MELDDAGSRCKPTLYQPNVTGFRNVFDYQAGDPLYLNPVEIHVWGGQILPPGAGTGTLVRTPNAPQTYAFGAMLWLHDVRCGDYDHVERGWTISFDGDILMHGGKIVFSGLNQMDSFNSDGGTELRGATHSGADTLQFYSPNFQPVGTVADGIVVQLAIKVTNTSFARLDGLLLYLGSKIIVDGPNTRLGQIKYDAGAVPPPVGGSPDAIIDVTSNGFGSEITGGHLESVGAVAQIRNASQKLRIIGVNFASPPARTILDTGAGNYTLGVGCIGVNGGTGMSLAANSKVTVGDYNFA
jgi:hypothetical protein